MRTGCGNNFCFPLVSSPGDGYCTTSFTGVKQSHVRRLQQRNGADAVTEKIPSQKSLFSAPEKYRAHNILGAGGMKVVIQSDDINACREVAMAISKDATPESYERFLNEARITASLEHPNIVPVHEIGTSRTGAPYFTMKLVHGCTLEHILKKLKERDPEYERKYPLRTLLEIFLKVCDGIAFAHSRGIIHLDLKPDNIQVGDYGEVLVLDWGLAKKIDEEQTDGDEAPEIPLLKISRMTMDGIIKGTPEYMAPEQAAGRNSRRGRRTDIYSLGAILYSMLTLDRPFSGGNTQEIIRNVLEGNIIPPHRLAADGRHIPQALEFVIYKAMERSPSRRYASVADLKADVVSYMNGYATVAEDAGFFTNLLLWLKRKKVQIYVVCSLVLTFLISAAFLGMHLYYRQQEKLVYGTVVRARIAAEQTIAGLEERIHKESASEWKLKYEDGFSDIYLYDRWGFFLGKEALLSMNQAKRYVKSVPGGIHIFSGPAGLNMIFRENLSGGEMRLLLELSWEDFKQGSMMMVSLNNDNFESGYLFAVVPGESPYMAVMRGSSHEILAEHSINFEKNEICKFDMILLPEDRGTTLKMSFNGRELIHYRDSGRGHVVSRDVAPCVMSFAKSSLILRSVKLMTLGTPIKVDLLDIASRQLRKGNYDVAKVLYIEAEESATSPERRRLAAEGVRLSTLLANYKSRIPEWNARLAQVWPGALFSIGIEPEGFVLKASGVMIDDLSVLRDMPLSTLSLSDAGVRNLDSLRRTKIRNLSLIRCAVSDLSPLEEMTLHSLCLDSVPVRFFPELKTQTLKRLALVNCGLESLEFLRYLKLESLMVSRNGIRDLSPLKTMPLKKLDVGGNRVESLLPLSEMPLSELNIAENRVVSLEPLRGKKLFVLCASGNQIADLSPLAGMPLTRLDLNFNRITSIAPLKFSPGLQRLMLIHNEIDDLGACSAFVKLERLYLDYNKIDSLEPLKKCMNLRTLSVSNNRLASLEPLRRLSLLRNVNCSENPLESLEGLEHVKLNKLYAVNTHVQDFNHFLRVPPRHFIFGNDSWLVGKWKTLLENLPAGSDSLRKSLRALIAYQEKDISVLRSLATEINGRFYLSVPVLADYLTARKNAVLFGARLPSWKTPLERGILMRGIETPFWLGVRLSGSELLSDDGSVFYRYTAFPPEMDHGCIFAPFLALDGIMPSRDPGIRLPLVFEWSKK